MLCSAFACAQNIAALFFFLIKETRQQLSETLRREPSQLPIMLVSARAGVGFNKIVDNRAQGGVLELQKELAGLAIVKKAE